MTIHSIHFVPYKKAGTREYVEFVLLVTVLIVVVGFIWWIQNGYTVNFIDSFR
ncbi:MAG: hypothetical protein WCO78_01225 [Candidatus Roizmanbacteria bacterium]